MSRNTQKTVIKVIAAILVAMMILSLLPNYVFAEETERMSDIMTEEAAIPEKPTETQKLFCKMNSVSMDNEDPALS